MPYFSSGWTAIVVRTGTSPEGLPIGVLVVARPWRDDAALAVAQHLEDALRGWQRPPLEEPAGQPPLTSSARIKAATALYWGSAHETEEIVR
jgi:hypothetical protein